MKTGKRPPVSTDVEAAASDWLARSDAGMTEDEKADFKRWAANPAHAQALARHEQAWAIPDRFRAAFGGAAMASEVRKRAERRRKQRLIATAACSLALVLAAGIVRHPVVFRDSAPRQAPVPANAVVLLPETRTLPDGSVVELKPGAELAVDFGGRLRRVALRGGEAYFQVAKNPARPFVVGAGTVEVRAVGTGFTVHLDPDRVEVLVAEGRVTVERDKDRLSAPPSGRSQPSPSHREMLGTIDAGNLMMVGLDPSVSRPPVIVPVSAPEMDERMAWRAARLEFDGTPLSQAVALLNRYNRVQIVVGDPSLADLKVSGYIQADHAGSFVNLLGQGLAIEAAESGGTITLSRKRPPGGP